MRYVSGRILGAQIHPIDLPIFRRQIRHFTPVINPDLGLDNGLQLFAHRRDDPAVRGSVDTQILDLAGILDRSKSSTSFQL